MNRFYCVFAMRLDSKRSGHDYWEDIQREIEIIGMVMESSRK